MNVLLAVDSVEFNKVMADFINSHSWQSGSTFRIVHAIEPALLDGSEVAFLPFLTELIENEKVESEKLVADMCNRIQAQKANSTIITEVIEGHACAQLLKIAAEWKADMVIVGSHGRKGISRFTLGSISSSVVALAPCSVVVLRLPKSAAQSTVKKITTSAVS